LLEEELSIADLLELIVMALLVQAELSKGLILANASESESVGLDSTLEGGQSVGGEEL